MLRIIRALWLHRLSFASIPNDTMFGRLAPYWQIDTQRGAHTLKVSLHCPPDWVITQNAHLLEVQLACTRPHPAMHTCYTYGFQATKITSFKGQHFQHPLKSAEIRELSWCGLHDETIV